MSAEKIIKAQARERLKGNYLKAAAALVILLTASTLVISLTAIPELLLNMIWPNTDETASGLLSVAVIVILLFAACFLSPFLNGYLRVFHYASKSGIYNLTNCFYYFSKGRYRKALALNFSCFLRMIVPTLVAFIPPALFAGIFSQSEDFFGTPGYQIPFFVLCVLSTYLVVFYFLKYFIVYTASFEYEGANPKELFRYSKAVMKGKTGIASRLILSFTPWVLLSFTVLPVLYTVPYITQSLCISSRWMEEAYRSEKG